MFTETTCYPMVPNLQHLPSKPASLQACKPSSLFPHVVLPKGEISTIEALSKLGLTAKLSAHPWPSQTRVLNLPPRLAHLSRPTSTLRAAARPPADTARISLGTATSAIRRRPDIPRQVPAPRRRQLAQRLRAVPGLAVALAAEALAGAADAGKVAAVSPAAAALPVAVLGTALAVDGVDVGAGACTVEAGAGRAVFL